MAKAKEEVISFIKSLIDQLADRHPHMYFKYGYDSIAVQHIIEVDPLDEFKSEEYLQSESEAILALMDKYPFEDVLFVSNHKRIKVLNPIYEVGKISAVKFKITTIQGSVKLTFPIMVSDSLFENGISEELDILFSLTYFPSTSESVFLKTEQTVYPREGDYQPEDEDCLQIA